MSSDGGSLILNSLLDIQRRRETSMAVTTEIAPKVYRISLGLANVQAEISDGIKHLQGEEE